MSERLRKAYEAKWRKEIAKRIEEKNKEHLDRQREAGRLFNARHGTEDDVCPKCRKSDSIEFVETPEFIHYGKMVCLRCNGKYIRFVPYPMGIGKSWKEEDFPDLL